MPRTKLPRVITVTDNQTGKTTRYIDKSLVAMKPGKRKSKSGKLYWETRKNRSDKNRRTRL